MSDHYMVYTCVNFKKKIKDHTTRRFRDYKNFNESVFIEMLKNTQAFSDNHESMNNTCINTMWKKWKESFLEICNEVAPIKEIRVKKRVNPWMTPEIVKLIYKRDYLKHKFDVSKSPQILDEYRVIRNNITQMVRENKRRYYNDVTEKYKGNSKELWKELQVVIGKDKYQNNTCEVNCDEMNEHFANVGRKIADTFPSKTFQWKHPECIYSFHFKKIESDTIFRHLKYLSEDSNLDVIDFDTKLLKIAAPYICESLTNMYNKSLISGVIPDDWKIGRTTPVYKGNGSKKDKNNYRPISVVSHLAKIIEKEVQSQLINYLIDNDMINVDQSAFLANHSTLTSLHRIIDDFYEAFNEKERVAACFLDISKCFDCIDYDFLMNKLEKYGILDVELKWFNNYVTNRKQMVQCQGKISKLSNLTIGIPQGSALGPTLFLIFINDISQYVLNGSCNIFADDVVIYVTGKDVTEVNSKLQENLNQINQWYTNNRLRINNDKTKVMLLKSKSCSELNIVVEGKKLEQVNVIKYLGLTIDDRLKWNSHVNNLCKSVAFKVHFLAKLRKYVNSSVLNVLYKSVIQPRLDYACSVWANCPHAYKKKLIRIQKRAARIVTGNFDYEKSCGTDIMKNLKWPSLGQRRDYFLATLMYRCINGTAPTRLCNEIEMYFDRHDFNTRNADTLNVIIPKPNLESFKQSFKFAGAITWNDLPDELQNAISLDSFKYNYKKLFFKN